MTSLGRIPAGGMPEDSPFAPALYPQSHYIQGSPAWMSHVDVASTSPRDGAGVVIRRPRLNGFRFLYNRGSQTTPWFRMRATGQVEKSAFQPTTASTWFAAFYDGLYQAGYPRNLGLSEKVASIPPEALGTSPSQMAPRPRYTRSIFTNRSYGTAPAIPAKPTQGMHS
jgi:hypothetical protein